MFDDSHTNFHNVLICVNVTVDAVMYDDWWENASVINKNSVDEFDDNFVIIRYEKICSDDVSVQKEEEKEDHWWWKWCFSDHLNSDVCVFVVKDDCEWWHEDVLRNWDFKNVFDDDNVVLHVVHDVL